ncbi:hypothetical protein MAC_06331 [Metarhizium acridum CQMa 102]|uniref:Uncharacterized protein n=2 Tax=Metarhizium acridum TaxID=92637 RepID=E9E8Y3_METAQ|nr:uncharacterized protein MAC_06331 [Metarhizium acridum CQMa 102]EFY87619.1 hypothetical protein MAC_06331 [Metarhizium acridum CQMa 102]
MFDMGHAIACMMSNSPFVPQDGIRQVDVGFRPPTISRTTYFSINALVATHQTHDTTHPGFNGGLSSIPQTPTTMDRSQPSSSNLMDNHNRLVADILTRYRTLMMLATVQAEGERNNATPETMAVSGISMKMEFDGLNSSIKDLLSLSRKIKELWVFGPLGQGDPDRKAKDAQIEEDVALVSALLNSLDGRRMRELAQKCGGSWEVLVKEDATTAK